MTLSLIIITLAGISQGVANTIRKHLAGTGHRATTIASTIMLLDSVLSIPFLFYEFRVSSDPVIWLMTVASVMAFALSLALLIKSYQLLDLSFATILQRSDILFIAAIGALTLGERLSVVKTAGIFFLFISVLIIMYEKRRIRLSRGAWFALLSAVCGAVASVLDKRILADFSPYTYTFVNTLLVGLVFVGRNGTLTESVRLIRKHTLPVLASSILGTATLVGIFTVLAVTPVSVAMPVYKTVLFLVPVLLGVTMYKERTKLIQKGVGAVFAVAGLVCMYI